MRNLNKRLFESQDATLAANSDVLRTKLLTRFTATGKAAGISNGSGVLKFQQNNDPAIPTMRAPTASSPGWVDMPNASITISGDDTFIITIEEIAATWMLAIWTPTDSDGPTAASTFYVDFNGSGFT